jgi:hypothetical protein
MSIRIMSRVWALSTRRGGELLILLALADFANDEGESWPSIPTLARKARLTERQARRVLGNLEAVGEIRIQNSNGGRNTRNHYFITIPENSDNITLKALQGNNNTVVDGQETLTPVSGALNRQGTVNTVESKCSRTKQPDCRVKEFADWWCNEYQQRVLNPYVFHGGKDGRLIKTLLRRFDLSKLQCLATSFFEANDRWVQQHGGYTIGVFASQINKLVSTANKADHSAQLQEMPL